LIVSLQTLLLVCMPRDGSNFTYLHHTISLALRSSTVMKKHGSYDKGWNFTAISSGYVASMPSVEEF
jgi:hypothetical protein